MTRLVHICCSTLLLVCWSAVILLFPQAGLAQTEPPSDDPSFASTLPAYLDILRIDRDGLPSVELTLVSSEMISNTVRNAGLEQRAEIEIFEDGVRQTILQDRVEENDLYLAVMIDPRALDSLGASGQPRYLEMVGVVLKLLQDDSVVRPNDLMAAFVAEENGGVGTLQAWTEESNQIFNTIIQRRSEMAMDDNSLVHDSILYALDKFNVADASPSTAKSLLLFSAGLDGDNMSAATLDRLIKQLSAEQIQVHVAQFMSQDPPAAPDQSLQRLSRGTGGHFVGLESEANFESLFQRIVGAHTQRLVTYNSEQVEPDEISVQLAFADGTTLSQQVNSRADAIEDNAIQDNAIQNDEKASTAEGSTDASVAVDNSVTVQSTPLPAEETLTGNAVAAEPVAENGGAENSGGTNNLAPVDEGASNKILIPGTDIVLSRDMILFALIATLLLLTYLLAVDFLKRKADRNHSSALSNSATDATRHSESQDHNYLRSQNRLMGTGEAATLSHATQAHTTQAHTTRAHIIRKEWPEATELKSFATSMPSNQPHDQFDTHPEKFRTTSPKAEMGQNFSGELYVDEPTLDFPVQPTPLTNLHSLDNAITEIPTGGQHGDLWAEQEHEVRRPMVGYFVRVTEDSNLPLKLPIYALETSGNEPRQIHIGRNGNCNTMVINAIRISREHAIVVLKGGRLYLRDNRSTAGTFLNWRKLEAGEELLIRNNDLISFGDVSYEFRAKGEDEATVLE